LEHFDLIDIKCIKEDHWAQTHGDYRKEKRICWLEIHNEFPNEQMLVWVLAHEMVHVWEWQIEGTMSHGSTFLKWKPKLAKYGLPLSVKV
jgi:Zn-dependent peptidase ImmA (M78 family)